MKPKFVSLSSFKSTGGSTKFKLAVLLLVVGMALPASIQAAEILTEEDFVKKIVVEDQFVKMADNFLILFDSSNSMKRQYKKNRPESRYEIARKILKDKLRQLPDLGYNSGLYLYTPYKEVYPMGTFDKGGFGQAIDSLPAEPKGPTFLSQSLRKIEPQLQGLSGKTIVYIFTDGTYTQMGQFKEPEDLTEELAGKYNVCFYMIGSPQDNRAQKRLVDMAKANACSRVVPFDKFVENPEYITGALYVVKATEKIMTSTESRIVGLKAEDIRFDFNKTAIRPEFNNEIAELADFLMKNSGAYVMLVGYTDSVGSEEYNLGLSQRRADSVAAHLVDNHGLDRDRIVLNWYGEANPIASNATAEGRAQNRRVEVAVGGM